MYVYVLSYTVGVNNNYIAFVQNACLEFFNIKYRIQIHLIYEVFANSHLH